MTLTAFDGRILLVLILDAIAAAVLIADWSKRNVDRHVVRALDGRPYQRNNTRGNTMNDTQPAHADFTLTPPDGPDYEPGTVHVSGRRYDARRDHTGTWYDLEDPNGWWKRAGRVTAATFEDADSADFEPQR